MRIGFNLLPYSPGVHGGAEVFLSNVINALGRLNPQNRYVLMGGKHTIEYYIPPKGNFETVGIPIPPRGSRLARAFLEQTMLPIICAKQGLDCIISNYVSPLIANCARVVIIHDMLYRRYGEVLERPKLLYWRLMLPASIRWSASVGTVSEFSRSEIEAFHPAVKNRIFVTTEGIRPSLASAQPSGVPFGLRPQAYLLCVATFGKHKNLQRLLYAFANLPNDCSEFCLVFVGAARTPDAKEYRTSVQRLIAQLGLTSRVIFTDHVCDAELASLYRDAFALVLPSLYEGFGLPVIEAQFFGCSVLCSNTASLPEVAGHGALMFDPTSVESIRDAILTLRNGRELRDQLLEAGRDNVSRFSWQEAATGLMRAIEFAVQQGGKDK